MRRKSIETQHIVTMYTQQHFTQQQIANLLGVSKAAIHKRLRAAGVNSEQGTWVDVNCGYCDAPIKIQRARWVGQLKAYCNNECKFASFSNPKYVIWRHGSRIARAIVAQHFPLQSDHVVHHVDGNERNFDLVNLAVYASHSDHMSMHRGHEVEPIWRGSEGQAGPAGGTGGGV